MFSHKLLIIFSLFLLFLNLKILFNNFIDYIIEKNYCSMFIHGYIFLSRKTHLLIPFNFRLFQKRQVMFAFDSHVYNTITPF